MIRPEDMAEKPAPRVTARPGLRLLKISFGIAIPCMGDGESNHLVDWAINQLFGNQAKNMMLVLASSDAGHRDPLAD